MLALVFRRLLWLVPTLFFVSIVTFLLFSLAPAQDERTRGVLVDRDRVAEQERAAFLDLPLFFNGQPVDVRVRARAAMAAVAAGGPDAEPAARELARLGGAALPYVIPALDGYEPEPRVRVALALAPIARRMRLPHAEDAADPERVTELWRRFWADRSVEFRDATVRTSVERLTRYRTASRAAEVAELDTFALPAVMEALTEPVDEGGVEIARALVAVAARATGRPDEIGEGATLAEATACVARWQRFWWVHESDFVAYDGSRRASASLSETRYGKWASGLVLSLTLERRATGEQLVTVSRAAPVTLALVFGGIGVAYALGTLLGVFAATSRRAVPRAAVSSAFIALSALPTTAFAVLSLRLFGADHSLFWGVVAVGLSLLSAPARHQRDAFTSVFVRDYVLAARARGAGLTRANVLSGLRQSLFGTLAIVTVEPPAALGAAFVAEAVLGLPGLGHLAVEAIRARDLTFSMGLVLGTVMISSLLLLFSDIAQATLDPRLRGRLGEASS